MLKPLVKITGNVQTQPILRVKAAASLSNGGHFMCNPT